jgi:outer membrane protein assembly factor BamB
MARLPLALTALLLAAAPAPADDWPQWRGPKNDGHTAETNLPVTWSETENVAWHVPLPGAGASTPCVWGDRIFLTSLAGPDLVALCYGTDGKERWRRPIGASNRAYRNDEGNDASASPSTDGKLVYVFSGGGRLIAFDLDGHTVWELDAQAKYGAFRIQFGVHQTPVLDGDRLYLSLIHRNAKLLVALDKRTGKEIWKHERKSDSPPGVESPDVYASPFVWHNGDRALLISHGDDYCTAHELTDGAEVWRVTGLNPKGPRYNRAWRAVSSPLVTPDLIVVPSCKRGVTVGVDPLKAKGEVAPGTPGELWRLPKDTPDVPSPIRVGDLVYLMGETGLLHCHDAKTGAKLYEERLTNMRHRANPVAAGDRIYLLGRDRVCAVVQAGRESKVLAKNELPDNFTASPAVAGGRLYLRGFKELWAVGAK